MTVSEPATPATRDIDPTASPLLSVSGLKKYFPVTRGSAAPEDCGRAGRRRTRLHRPPRRDARPGGGVGLRQDHLGRTILRLIEPTSGEIVFNGKNVRKLNTSELRYMRREMQIIFQDPFSSLNPRQTIAETIEEPILPGQPHPGQRQAVQCGCWI